MSLLMQVTLHGSLVALLLLWPVSASGDVEDIRALLRSGDANAALDRLATELAAAAEGERVTELRELRAHCLFVLGRFPEAAVELRGLRAEAEPGSARWATLGTRLAQVESLRGNHDGAVVILSEVVAVEPTAAVRRALVRAHVRARRYVEALPHVEALLAAGASEDAVAHYYRGLALAKTGRYAEALPELAHGLADSGTRRDAGFESALALARLGDPARALEPLLGLVEEDPLDAAACYQAARQLLALRAEGSATTAGHLMRYFRYLEETAGADSRDRHLEAAGEPARAAVVRAARWERLGSLERCLATIAQARRLHPDSPERRGYLVEFWLRHGLDAEAKREAEALPDPPPEIHEARKRPEPTADGPSGALLEARRELAATPWSAAEGPLRRLLEAAVAERDSVRADAAARLLLARDPHASDALRYLAARTSSPALLAPHLHYLARLVEAEPDDPRWRAHQDAAREVFLGRTPARREGAR